MIIKNFLLKIRLYYWFFLRSWDYDEKTIEKCNKILKQDIHNEDALIIKGDTYKNMKLFDNAIDCYREIVEYTDDDFEKKTALLGIVEILYDLDYFKECIPYLDELIKLDGDDYSLFLNKGYCYYNLERYAEALDCFEKSVNIKPDYIQGILNISKCHQELGNYYQANIIFDELLNEYPDSTTLLLEKATRTENNSTIYDSIINSVYDWNDPFLKGKNKSSSKEYLDGIKADAYFLKGDELLKQNNINQAVNCKIEGLKLKDDYDEIYLCGELYFDLNDYENANYYFDEFLNVYPQDEDALYYKGRIHEELNDRNSAIKFFNEVLHENPECKKAKKRLNLLSNC